jgi:hypothetical protein
VVTTGSSASLRLGVEASGSAVSGRRIPALA